MNEIAFVNGKVITVDPDRPTAEAVLVRGERIAVVGTERDVRAAATRTAELVDLDGGSLLPGFQDAHAHPVQGGLEMAACNLLDAPADRSTYLDIVATYAAAHRDREWITGGGWAMDAFPGGVADRESLDALVPDRPVFLWNRDHHGAWVNSRALEVAGIGPSTPDPVDGRIERDGSGAATGTLQEGAAEAVAKLLPATTAADRRAALLEAQRYLFGLGVTAWQDAMVEPETHDTYVAAAADGSLLARVVGCLWWERDRDETQIAGMIERRASTPPGPYRATSVKIMQDGVCENHTAAMLDPYLDANGTPTENAGLSFVEPAALRRYVTALDAAGFQVHFHALGDRAVRESFDAVEAARRANGTADRRHHLAHLQVVDPHDRSRFASLGAGANAQPLWAHHDGYQDDLTIPFLGPDRSALQYPWRSLLDAGALLALGSDWPVSTPDPMQILHVAVHRVHPEGKPEVFYPTERISPAEAIRAYTMGSAWLNHAEQTTGSIEPAKRADLVCVDRDITKEPFLEARARLTLVDGTVVHDGG